MYVCGLSPTKRLDWLGLGKVFSKKYRIRVLYFICRKSGKINTKYLKQKSLNIRLKNTRNKKLPIQMIVTKVISNSWIVTLVAVLLKPIWCLMWKCYMETWVLSVLTICAMKRDQVKLVAQFLETRKATNVLVIFWLPGKLIRSQEIFTLQSWFSWIKILWILGHFNNFSSFQK